ncbi:MAG: chemotaxis protein CheW [Deltaproteobacteria bacterium]|nr:chemotaxis protein CheW [Deltaproteobacteria bacterium]
MADVQALAQSDVRELITFYLNGGLFGVDVAQVREVNRLQDITRVPHAPEFVCGVINLRGEIVTVVDLRLILNMPATELSSKTRIVIVTHQDEQIGLLVDEIADVLIINVNDIEPIPPNISAEERQYFSGVCKMESLLTTILNLNGILT